MYDEPTDPTSTACLLQGHIPTLTAAQSERFPCRSTRSGICAFSEKKVPGAVAGCHGPGTPAIRPRT